MSIRAIHGDCRAILPTLPDESVHCVVTSPPYFALRDYQTAGQIGLEATPDAYVAELVAVFRECRRVLRDDGTLWVVIGDSYAAGGGYFANAPSNVNGSKQSTNRGSKNTDRKPPPGLKAKDLLGIPWAVAFALRADGWYLRQDIIWSKPNPMPESVQDRFCKSHEYVFLFSKSPKYFFDIEAVKEDVGESLQYMSQGTADIAVLQKQSAARRTNGEMPRLHRGGSQNIRSEIQQIHEGQSNGSQILLFGEGAGSEESLSSGLRDDGRAAGEIPDSRTAARKRRSVQGEAETLRPNSQGEGNQSQNGQEVSTDRQWSVQQTQDSDQAQTSNPIRELHIDQGSMAGDQSAIPEPMRVLQPGNGTAGNGSRHPVVEGRSSYDDKHRPGLSDVQREEGQSKRTKRSVWHIATQSFSDAHFATFPLALIEPCIKAGCPAKACAACGKPWVREVEIGPLDKETTRGKQKWTAVTGQRDNVGGLPHRARTTLGFSPSCSCNAATVPGVCLDPFSGAGTTGLVADRLGRDAILIELNEDYSGMSRRRIHDDAPLFAEVLA